MLHFSHLFAVLLLLSASVATTSVGENSTIIQQHRRARSLMIELERDERQDAKFRRNLSTECQKADKIVKRIRQEEINTIWAPTNTTFAGQMFPLARDKINGTNLWEIVKRMPKGALLHAHLTAMLPYDKLINIVVDTPGMKFSASRSLDTSEGLNEAKIKFSYENASTTDSTSIYSSNYKENTLVPAKESADTFKNMSGFPVGQEGFRQFVKSKMVVATAQATRHELGVNEIWSRFEPLFDPAGTMLTYEPVVRKFWQQLFQELVDDRISWVEIRAGGSKGKLRPMYQTEPSQNASVWWEILSNELEAFKNNQTKDTQDPFHGARIIWSDKRFDDRDNLTKSMASALERKHEFRELFSGYDVITQEDTGRTLLDMAPELLEFQENARNKNLSMPFFFHAGETLGDGNTTDLNLFDAILMGTRRIGHGFSLYKHPEMIQAAIKNNVMVEVCPISNEVLRLATDILHHPMPAMIAHGVPTAISNDDPAMLGQDIAGLSYDFYQVIQAFENIGLAGLGALAQNSLRWSNFEDQSDKAWLLDIELGATGDGTKGQRIQTWNKQWQEYCVEIVTNDTAKYYAPRNQSLQTGSIDVI